MPKDFPILKTSIDKLIPDSRNANAGTQRGQTMLDNSLRTLGAGRSILLDKYNRIIAGNKTAERAADIGMDDVFVVETDGNQLVAVKRMDLDLDLDPKARELAYADNRVAQVDIEWQVEQILEDVERGVDLVNSGLFKDYELSAMIEKLSGEATTLPQMNVEDMDDGTKRMFSMGESSNSDEDEDDDDSGSGDGNGKLFKLDGSKTDGSKETLSREDKTYHFNFSIEFSDSILVKRAIEEYGGGDYANDFLVAAASSYLKGIWSGRAEIILDEISSEEGVEDE